MANWAVTRGCLNGDASTTLTNERTSRMKTVFASLLAALLAALAFAASAAPTTKQTSAAEPQSATCALDDEDKDKDTDKEGPKKD